jgi:PHS family inorganic phosphate transporter-like MFS transporter
MLLTEIQQETRELWPRYSQPATRSTAMTYLVGILMPGIKSKLNHVVYLFHCGTNNHRYTIFDVLKQNSIQSMWVVSISSLIGSILFIFVVDRIPRRKWLIWSFAILCVLFVITGATFPPFVRRDGHYVTILLVALCHFAFNFGANTLTFIIPAEIFPTTYRALCHGIAAAAGKLGSIIILIILHKIDASDPHKDQQLAIFISFGGIMAIGAVVAWLYVPNTQHRDGPGDGYRLENTTLETLGVGLMKTHDGQAIGVRERLKSRREAA